MKKTLEKAARESLTNQTNTYNLAKEEINTLVSVGIIPQNTPPTQISLFAKVCQEKGLSPFSQQIHLIRRRVNNEARYTHQTSIDGYRSIAGRTGLYAGNDDYLFNEGVTEYQMLKSEKNQPLTSTATVYKMIGGVRCPFSATARWVEYYPGDRQGFMWKKMPFLMLGKCLPGYAKIKTNRGVLRIAEIVNKKIKVKVESFNETTGLIEWKGVIGWYRNGSANKWYRLYVNTNNNGKNYLTVSAEHKLLTQRGWVEAKDITTQDMLSAKTELISKVTEQVLLGSLLGDGYAGGRKGQNNTAHYSESHSSAQRYYLEWKFDHLKDFDPTLKEKQIKVAGKVFTVYKLLTKSSQTLNKFRDLYYSPKKKVTREILDKLNDLGLAIWIMDDGSFNYETRTKIPYNNLRIHTCFFGLSGNEIIKKWFEEKYGVVPTIHSKNKNPILYFNQDDTEKIKKIIKPYMKIIKSSKIWVSKTYPQKDTQYTTIKIPIFKIDVVESVKIGKYDIEVADNHNFLYNNIVVHNCAEALALRKAFPDQLGKLYIDEEMENIQPVETVTQLEKEVKEKTENGNVVSVETVKEEKPKKETKKDNGKMTGEDYCNVINSYTKLKSLDEFQKKNTAKIKTLSKDERDAVNKCFVAKEKEISDKLVELK